MVQRFHHAFGVLMALLLLAPGTGFVSANDNGIPGDLPDVMPVVTESESDPEQSPPDQQDEQAVPADTEELPAPTVVEPDQADLPAAEEVPAERVDAGNPPTGPPAPEASDGSGADTAEPLPEVDAAPSGDEEMPAEDTPELQEVSAPQSEEAQSGEDAPVQQRVMSPQSGEATAGNDDENDALVTTQAVTRDVTITVLDWDDNLIPGASVTVVGYSTSTIVASGTTGSSGTFVAENLEPDYYDITAAAPGFFENSTSIEFDGNETEPLTASVYLNQDLAGVLTLTVRDLNTDTPIPNASVVVSVDNVVVQRGNADATGVFTSQALPGGYASLLVSAAGYESRSDSVYIQGNTDHSTWLIPLIDGELTITVLDTVTDDPIAGATVSVTDIDRNPLASATTNAAGVAVIESVPGGSVLVTVSATGYETREERQLWVQGNTEETFWLREASKPGVLTLDVVNTTTDAPVSGASVELSYNGVVVASGTTDANGVYTTPSALDPDAYTLIVNATGYVEWYGVATVHDGPTTVSVRMQPVSEGVLTITVRDQDTNAVIPDASVTVSRSETNEEYTGTTDSQGVYTTPSLTTGLYDIAVTATGYTPELYGIVNVDGNTEKTIYLVKPQHGFLTIKVVDEDTGLALPGVSVKITDDASGAVIEANGLTDATGTYASPLLQPASHTVELTLLGYWPVEVTHTIQDSHTLYVSMLEQHDATLAAHVYEHGTLDPIAGAHLTIFEFEYSSPFQIEIGDLVASATTDSEGAATTVTFDPGYYVMLVSKDGYEAWTSSPMLFNGAMTKTFEMTKTDPDNPTPEPSETPVVTPDPSETPVTPEPSETPVVTPDPSETPEPSETPDPGETPEPSVTPEPSETPDPSETPVVTPDPGETPEPSETPVVTPDPDETPEPTTPAEESPLTVNLEICANETCDAPHSTDLDGFTASWTVTGEQTAVTTQIERARLASVGGTGAPVSLALMQQQSLTLTAVVEGGVATATSDPLPIGLYTVCLDPVLTGAGGDTVQIADETVCSVVTLTVNGVEDGAGTAFRVVNSADPDDQAPGEPADPSAPDDSDEPDTPGGPDDPTTPDDQNDLDDPGTTPTDPTETEIPGTGDTATDPDADTDTSTGSESTGATGELAVVVSTGTAGSGNETASASSGSTGSVSGLPTTGSGTPDTTFSATAWTFAMSALLLMALAILLRQHDRA